jgi:ABC-type multidrug transport system fused ATPase/permease subunit
MHSGRASCAPRGDLTGAVTFPPDPPFTDGWSVGLTVLENMTGIRVPAEQDATREALKSRLVAFIQGNEWSERIVRLALDCSLAEEGRNLSGGQREKVAIARVLLTRPRILLLDEITAALDRVSAETVQRTLREVFPATTVVAVMHDLETARWYDRIIVVGDGRIVGDLRVADGADDAIGRVRHLLDMS